MRKYLSIWLIMLLTAISCGHLSAQTMTDGRTSPLPRSPWLTDPGFDSHPITVDMGLSVDWGWTNVGSQSVEDPGYYFAWGETETKTTFSWDTYKHGGADVVSKYCRNTSFGPYDGLMQLEPDDDAARQHCADDAHIPTDAEWQELFDNSEQTLTEQNGVKGYLITSRLTGESIFLPFGGYRSSISYCEDTGGYYWASTYNGCYATNGQMATFSASASKAGLSSIARFIGMNIRPVYTRERPLGPTSAIVVTPTLLDFGCVAVGDSKTMSFTITNISENAVIINSLPISGGNWYSRFGLDWYGGTIAAGASQTINLTYTAVAAVDKDEDSIEITYEGMPEGYKTTVSFCANVYQDEEPTSAITVTPTLLDFGCVAVGDSKTMSFTIANYSDSAIYVPLMAESFGNFALSWNGDSIPMKTKQTVHVTYTPNLEIDGNSLQLVIQWDGMNGVEPIIVELVGQCADTTQQMIPFAVEPDLLDFTNMIIGETRTLTLGITNLTDETQTILDFCDDVTGGFSVDWTGGDIGPGSTQEVKATCTAVEETAMTSCVLNIRNEAMRQEGSAVIVPVWMSAVEPPAPTYAIAVSPDEIIFENVVEGETQTKMLTVSNNTDGEVIVCDFSSNNEQITLDWEGGSLQAGEIRAVHVTYAPKADGTSASTTLSLATTEMAADNQSIAVSVKASAIDKPTYETAKTHLLLWNKDGSRVAFILAERPRVSFANDKLFIETTRMAAHYDLNNFQRFTYETEEDILTETMPLESDESPFCLEGERLTFVPGTTDLNVRVISSKGVVLQQLMVHKGESLSIPLDLFETGVYLINVNGETYKLFLR